MAYIDTPDARLTHTCSAHCHGGMHGLVAYTHPRLTADQLTRDAALQGLLVVQVLSLSDPPTLTPGKSYVGFAPGTFTAMRISKLMYATYTQGWIVLCANRLCEEQQP
jgi:hypothetical protein